MSSTEALELVRRASPSSNSTGASSLVSSDAETTISSHSAESSSTTSSPALSLTVKDGTAVSHSVAQAQPAGGEKAEKSKKPPAELKGKLPYINNTFTALIRKSEETPQCWGDPKNDPRRRLGHQRPGPKAEHRSNEFLALLRADKTDM
jgi:hypothetical protein